MGSTDDVTNVVTCDFSKVTFLGNTFWCATCHLKCRSPQKLKGKFESNKSNDMTVKMTYQKHFLEKVAIKLVKSLSNCVMITSIIKGYPHYNFQLHIMWENFLIVLFIICNFHEMEDMPLSLPIFKNTVVWSY